MKYDKYKNSGIEWLSEIPEHWTNDRLKNIFSFGTGLSITKKDLLEVGIPCVNYGEIHSKYGFEVNPEIHLLKCVPVEYINTSKKSLLKKGDFLFADTSEDIEGSGNFTYLNSSTKVFAGYHTIAAKPKCKLTNRYVAYLFDSLSFRNQFRSNVVGIKVYSITQGLLNRLQIYSPTNQEQTTIAQYLDTKTQAIDKKINLLTQKINYYKELRKSIINDSVCTGLDKKVKLQESGIEWIGKIPQHWKITRVKDSFNLFTGNSISDKVLFERKENSIDYVSTKDIDFETGQITYDNGVYIPIEDKSFKIAKANSILICIEGANAGKKIGFTSKDICFVNKLCAIKSRTKNNFDKYFFYYTQSPLFEKQFFSILNGLIGGVSLSSIKYFDIITPTKEEQIAIAAYLDEKTQKIDSIVNNIRKQIETLKELRKTLINDVVTGKIKVTI